jgi:hypothetical protein
LQIYWYILSRCRFDCCPRWTWHHSWIVAQYQNPSTKLILFYMLKFNRTTQSNLLAFILYLLLYLLFCLYGGLSREHGWKYEQNCWQKMQASNKSSSKVSGHDFISLPQNMKKIIKKKKKFTQWIIQSHFL